MAAACGADLDPATAAELRPLRALARWQAQELEILEKSHCLLFGDLQPMSRYRFIEAQRGQDPIRLLCQVLCVPASGYYAWEQAPQQVQAARAVRAPPVGVFALFI